MRETMILLAISALTVAIDKMEKNALRRKTGVWEITLPDGITEITEDYIKENLPKGTTQVVIPEGVKSIGYDAFSDRKSLKSVVIPEGVTSIGTNAFFGCESLKSVVIPKGVTSIRRGTFFKCTSLKSVVIPKGVISIRWGTFFECTSLKSVVIPEGVSSIEEGTFFRCRSLKSVEIPQGVTSIGTNAFSHCESLTTVVIPKSVKSIGYDVFSGCTSLESILIPKGVTSIGSRTFTGCENLGIIIFPDNYFDQRIKEAEKRRLGIPDGAKLVTKSEFNTMCTSIKEIYSGENRFIGKDGKGETKLAGQVLLLYEISKGEIDPDDLGKNQKETLEKVSVYELNWAVNKIEDEKLKSKWQERFTTLKKTNRAHIASTHIAMNTPILGKKMDGILESIDKKVYGLKKDHQARIGIILDENLKVSEVKKGSPAEAQGLKKGDVIQEIDGKNLENLDKQDALELIRGKPGTQSHLKVLRKDANEEVELVIERAHRVHEGLKDGKEVITKVNIPDGITCIGKGAYKDCKNLKSVSMTDTVKEIGPGAFEGCQNLEKIEMASGIEEIGKDAFKDCRKLKELVLPDAFFDGEVINVEKLGEIGLQANITVSKISVLRQDTKSDKGLKKLN